MLLTEREETGVTGIVLIAMNERESFSCRGYQKEGIKMYIYIYMWRTKKSSQNDARSQRREHTNALTSPSHTPKKQNKKQNKKATTTKNAETLAEQTQAQTRTDRHVHMRACKPIYTDILNINIIITTTPILTSLVRRL